MSDYPNYVVWFRGRPACPCLATWLPAYEAELQRRRILIGALTIYQLIGGAPQSGGTHTRGGAFDLLDLPGAEDVWVARQMGADATWLRPYNWDGDGGIAHVHGVLTGCPHNEPARYQIAAVDAGFNGLGSGGRGARDEGPRPLSGRTWREGIAWARAQEDDMAEYADQLDKIQAAAESAAADAAKAVRLAEGIRRRALAQTTRLRARLDAAIATGNATRAELEQLRDQVGEIESAVGVDEA